MFQTLDNPVSAMEIAIKEGNVPLLKYLLHSSITRTIRQGFLDCAEVYFNKIVAQQSNPLPMMEVFTRLGVDPHLVVHCLLRKDKLTPAYAYAETLPVDSNAASKSWASISKWYWTYISQSDGPNRKGPGSAWDAAMKCARKVAPRVYPELFCLRTNVWNFIFEHGFKRGGMTAMEFAIAEEAAGNCYDGWDALRMLAGEHLKMGDVKGAERCERKAVELGDAHARFYQKEEESDEDEEEDKGQGEAAEGGGDGEEESDDGYHDRSPVPFRMEEQGGV